jgi:CBS domain containing-hemolysin-like protein
MRPVFQVQYSEPVYAMLQRMKLEGVQLAVVTLEDGSQFVITIKDLIKRLLPQD